MADIHWRPDAIVAIDAPESQAIADVYMERVGDVTMADRYHKRAGSQLADQLNTIFQ